MPLFAVQKATITLDFQNIEKNALEKPLVGMFMEYIQGSINSPLGISAQELQDRGFDCQYPGGPPEEKYQYWHLLNTCSVDSIEVMYPWINHYNSNGMRHYFITRSATKGDCGFQQEVRMDADKDYEFYIHCKGTVDSVYLRLIKSDGEVIVDKSLGAITTSWQKYSVMIAPLQKSEKINVIVYSKSNGDIHFDEASLMATDNRYSLRSEVFGMLKEMNMKILRFPGGCFADYFTWHFEQHIGPRDQRRAPNYWYDSKIQRMDFGLDEYLEFCEELNIVPFLTVNVMDGSVQEALNLVEYCNGDQNTLYGRKRAINGHPEPFNVKYFEIGNEQWENVDINYPSKYLNYYAALKEKDSTLEIIVNGNHWAGIKDVKRVLSVVEDNADFYSWHPCSISYQDEESSLEEEYWGMVSWSLVIQSNINWLMNEVKANGGKNLKHAPTEYWVNYERDFLDTCVKAHSLEAALSDMNFVHSFLRNHENTGPACRTLYLGILKTDTIGKERKYYTFPNYEAYKMIFSSIGNDFIPTKYNGDMYSLPDYQKMQFLNDVPMLDVVATKNKDTLFLAVISRHISEPTEAIINIPSWTGEHKVKITELSSPNYLDYNSFEEPNKVVAKSREEYISNTYKFPPHSYTVIAIPTIDILIDIEIDPPKVEEFNILPNPASDKIFFDAYGKTIDYLKIYDMTGKEVKNIKKNNFGFMSIDISELNSGTYFIQGTIEGKEIQGKFIKQ